MADDEGNRSWLPSMPRLRRLPMVVGAAIAGLTCGLVATGLVWGGEQGCDAVRGRPSCGGYGLLMLLGIIAVCFALGVFVLTIFGVADPGVTTFFGITLPLLAILGVLLDYVFDTWMAFGLPLLVAGCFVLSAYLARALAASDPRPYADQGTTSGEHDREGPPHYVPPDVG